MRKNLIFRKLCSQHSRGEESGKAVRTPPHTHDNACDPDCNVCGATRTPSSHVYAHYYDTDCNVCGAVREVEPVLGDADGDGMAAMADAVLLQRYLNGWDADVYTPAADVNGDGKWNNKDLILLLRQLTGWQKP